MSSKRRLLFFSHIHRLPVYQFHHVPVCHMNTYKMQKNHVAGTLGSIPASLPSIKEETDKIEGGARMGRAANVPLILNNYTEAAG
jgi:hypothetical protein